MNIFLIRKKKYLPLISILFLIGFEQELIANSRVNSNNDNELIKNSIIFSISKKENESFYHYKFKNLAEKVSTKIDPTSNKENKDIESLDIISDSQYRIENDFIAEGNVLINKNNMSLRADKLIYNLDNKTLIISGNIRFQSEEQFLNASKIKYNLLIQEGFIKDASGTINFDKLKLINNRNKFDNNSSNQKFKQKNSTIKNVKLTQIIKLSLNDISSPLKFNLDINEMSKWRFQSKEIKIKKNIWSSDILFLTNDPYDEPQIKIKNSNIKSIEKNGIIEVRSSFSSIILEDNLTLPLGPRNYSTKKGSNSKWSIGYDKPVKDGVFINRYFDSVNLFSDKTTLNLNQEFFIQRALTGKTKSFSKKNSSVLDDRFEQDTNFLDYFGLSAKVNSKIIGFEFESDISLNSLDFEKFKKIATVKGELSKSINYFKDENTENETKLSFFGKYRDKVWNGSIGERDILTAYGIKLVKNNYRKKNNLEITSKIGAGFGEYQANKRYNKKSIISRERLNLLLHRKYIFPFWSPKSEEDINKEFLYTPEIIKKGINILFSSTFDYYSYSDKNYQNLLSFKFGPQMIFGDFKKKYFDFTEINLLSKTTISSGKSPFDFDQSVDKHAVEIEVKQQLIGPLTIGYSSEYNLDENSTKYNQFFNNKYELAWNRRAYNFGLFYDSERKTGGFNFQINGFSFDGYGNKLIKN